MMQTVDAEGEVSELSCHGRMGAGGTYIGVDSPRGRYFSGFWK